MLHRLPGVLLLLFVLSALPAAGQTLGVTNNVHRAASLTNTVITLSGRAELHLTDPGDPLTGSTVHLNSPDAWLFLHSVVPSQVAANFLSRIRVNGSAAVLDSNVRVVQYELGAVVIPHGPKFAPLEVFDGESYTGPSKKLGLYTYHRDAELGELKNAIGSFRLKRGYMATVAQQENGGGTSKVYIAQDGDLDIGTLPAALDNQIRFIRVFPWRWVSKKGWAGAEGNYMQALWRYNWNNSEESTLDREYVPIRQTRWWPGLPTDKRNVTHLLGFNEPDRPDQANMSVDAAIAAWPELMATGLRLGAPAVSDGGLAWLYEFIDKADALGYRVDYVPVHFYRAQYSDTALRDWLKGISDRCRGRPVWVTEFNNGANWTCCLPTQQENAVKIGQFIDIMNASPFVERYSVFNWVEDNRRMVWDDPNGDWGWPLPAGERYRDTPSPVATIHDMPDNGQPAAAHYSFDGHVQDISGNGHDAAVMGAATFITGKSGQAVSMDGSDSYLQLPSRLGDSTDFTFAAWVNWAGGANWQRIVDLGKDTSSHLFLTPKSGNGNLRFAIKNGGAEQQLNHSTALPVGAWTHVAVTIGGTTGKLFVNGNLVAVSAVMDIDPAALGTRFNYLGKSQFADPLFNGRIDDVRFLTTALGDAEIASLAAGTLPQFSADPLTAAAAATVGHPYTGSIASEVSGGALTFSKVGGPAWLAVAGDGTLTGVPGQADLGVNTFLIRASTATGAADTAVLRVTVEEPAGMVAGYAFDSNVQSAVGRLHGTAIGTPSYPPGLRAQAIDLDGTEDAVSLPAGIADTDERTVAAWVNWDGGGNWQRVFDFGNGTQEYFFLSPKNGSNRMAFTIRKDGVEHTADATTLAIGQWVHLAAVFGGGQMRLHVNGTQVATAASPLKPSDIRPASNFIGDSQFAADPFFNGRIEEFRVFNRALAAAEINAFRNGRAPVFTANPLTRPAAAIGQAYEQTLAGSATDADAGGTLVFAKAAGPRWLTVDENGRLSGVPDASDAGLNRFMVRVTDSAGLATETELEINIPGPPDLIAHYQFDNDATDRTGAAAGTATGGPGYDDGVFDRAIRLDGVDDHVALRPGLMNGITDTTIAARVRWNGGSQWQRIFDFGNNTTQYMLLTPRSGTNTLRFGITLNGNAAGAQQVLETAPPPAGEWTHVAVTLTGNTGTLYVNGAAAATGPITIDPAVFAPLLNYLGKSQYPDPYFNGLMDDFRTYSRGLSAAEVRALAVPPPATLVPDPSYDAWAASSGLPEDGMGAEDDPDSDGVENLLEYLFGTPPMVPGTSGLPKAQLRTGAELGAAAPEKHYLSFSARVKKTRPGVTLFPEAAATLEALTLPAASGTPVSAGAPTADGDFEIHTWYYPVAIEDAPQGFMRLRVSGE